MVDDMVIVGGLAPALLVDQVDLPEGAQPHVGTVDLDIGISLALLEDERYRRLTSRLRDAGFAPDVNEDGRTTRQRWTIRGPAGRATVDFLVPPGREDDRGGTIRSIESDFAAVIAPGLRLAFQDRISVRMSGTTIMGESAVRDILVCGPAAFIVMKALAFAGRGENKDAYDLFYVARNAGRGAQDPAGILAPLATEPECREAIGVIRRDFTDLDALGPRRVAEFLLGRPDESVQAEVAGFMRRLIG